MRSFSLDLTKNLFPLPVLKKLVDLMKMYKLNHLILNLADDHAWRLEVDGIDFPELHTVSLYLIFTCFFDNSFTFSVYGQIWADDILKHFLFFQKTGFDISCK